MSKDFVKNRIGSKGISEAQRQQKQLSYFTTSVVQEDITEEYIKQWAERKYKSDDDFINWVKTVFRTDNFLSFYKYFRQPVASSKLVNDIIKPQLSRLFFAEDSYFRYTVKGEEIHNPEELDCESFDTYIFNALLFRHNDILIVDLEDVNKPYRELVSINDVIAIKSEHSVIKKIAHTGHIEIENELGEETKIDGYVYMDEYSYIFYDKEYNEIKNIPHDLGVCPADYVSNEAFGDNDVVRRSIFSYVREELEEYVFLKTLQRMTEPNGSIPIVTQLQTREKSKGADAKGSSLKEPMAAREIGGQKSDAYQTEVTGNGSNSLLQTGTIITVPMIKRDDGSLDMEAVKSFINFFYIPTESLEYLNNRIQEIRDSILKTVLGDMADQTNDRKNELQVKGGFASAEDRLRELSIELSRIRKRSDFKMLGLKYGVNNISNDAFYGSDFFLESQKDLYNLFKESPNPIERKNILIRLSKNRNRFNSERSKREVLMYELMPYSADTDFEKAVEKGAVDIVTFQLQTRFNYWISLFEAKYGDLVYLWDATEGEKSEKIVMMNNLLIGIVKEDLDSKQLSENELLLQKIGSLRPEVASLFVEQLESSEIRGVLGKEGSKQVTTATVPQT